MSAEELRQERPDLDTLLREDRDYQSAYDRKVSQALATARANWERDRQGEEDRIRQTLEAEMQETLEQERQVLAGQRQDFDRRLRQVAVGEALQQRGLDARFAPWITGESDEDSAQRVEAFTGLFQEALSQAVAGRMRGEAAPREPDRPRELTREQVRGMSPREINRNWEQISGLLRETQ